MSTKSGDQSRSNSDANPDNQEHGSLAKIITDNNLYYLGYMSGILDEIPKDLTDSPPRNRNFEMWKTSQILCLISDIISLSVYFDSVQGSIREIHVNSLEKIFSVLQEAEYQQPLGYFRMSTNQSESEDIVDKAETPEHEATPVPQEERRTESRRRHTSDRVKSLARTEQATESQQEKIMKQDLIWDNTELFMKSIPNINKFATVLAPSKPFSYPPSVLTDSFGPHYSTTIPQDHQLMNDHNKEQLILPPPPSFEARPKGVFAQIHTRLIASFMNITPKEYQELPKNSHNDSYDLRRGRELIDQLISQSNNNSSAQLHFSMKSSPKPTGLGVAPYGLLEFDEKLKLELQSLEFTNSDLPIVFADCPVSNNIEYQVLRQDEIVASTNRVKDRITELLQKNKEVFEEEIAYKKDWDEALQRFLNNQASKHQTQPQQSKKKKKTE